MVWLQTEDGNFFIVGTYQRGSYDLAFLFWDEKTFRDYYAEKECKVFVDDREVLSDVPAVKHGPFVEVPMVAVLRAFGAEITWDSETTASVCYEGDTYLLDTKNATFINEWEGDDLLDFCFAAGGYSTYYPKDGEIMISDVSMIYILERLGIEVNLRGSKEDATIIFVSH